METSKPSAPRARPSSIITTSTSRRRKRTSGHAFRNPTESYLLAYPAPISADKLHLVKHLRPRLYLQLQRLSDDRLHHTPAVDVISPGVKRTTSKAMASTFKTCVQQLSCGMHYVHPCKRDVLVVESVPDTPPDPHLTPDLAIVPSLHSGRPEIKRVAAILRPNNEITTRCGEVWTASERPNRSFEFVTVNDHGVRTVARWVLSRSHRRSRSFRASADGARMPPSPAPNANETSYIFSLIDPTVRRHAVLATLSPTGLDIKETYHNPNSITSGSEDDGEKMHVVDGPTKALIVATAVWLILRLGWSPAYEANRTHSHNFMGSMRAKTH